MGQINYRCCCYTPFVFAIKSLCVRVPLYPRHGFSGRGVQGLVNKTILTCLYVEIVEITSEANCVHGKIIIIIVYDVVDSDWST